MIKCAAIFDFNGTLFWDSHYHSKSWYDFLDAYDIQLSSEDINHHIQGRNAKDIFEFIFKREFSKAELDQLVEEKESLYREECLQNGMALALGAIELIQYLKDRKIPIAIATASRKTNVEFFIEHFELLTYFNRDNIIYDDGKSKGKPHPDLFLKAIKSLSVNPENVTIFEDSIAGIEAAKRCSVKNVVLVNSSTSNNDKKVISISDFSDFDRGLL